MFFVSFKLLCVVCLMFGMLLNIMGVKFMGLKRLCVKGSMVVWWVIWFWLFCEKVVNLNFLMVLVVIRLG